MKPRTLILHHPIGHPYWQDQEYRIQLPDGQFYDKSQHSPKEPHGAPHKILIQDDGIYYQRCGASSGAGKTDYKDPFIIIQKSEYDIIEFVGIPLVMPIYEDDEY